jgi:hypothetical protein
MVGERKSTQERRAMRGEAEQDLTAIGAGMFAADGATLGKAVHQLDGAVMLDLQAFSQLADVGSCFFGETFKSKKELVLLRLQAMLAGGFGAEL